MGCSFFDSKLYSPRKGRNCLRWVGRPPWWSQVCWRSGWTQFRCLKILRKNDIRIVPSHLRKFIYLPVIVITSRIYDRKMAHSADSPILYGILPKSSNDIEYTTSKSKHMTDIFLAVRLHTNYSYLALRRCIFWWKNRRKEPYFHLLRSWQDTAC